MNGDVSISGLDQAPTNHAKLLAWVREIAALTKPAAVHWCDGSDEEFTLLTDRLVELGTMKRLNPDKLHLFRERDRRRPDQQLV